MTTWRNSPPDGWERKFNSANQRWAGDGGAVLVMIDGTVVITGPRGTVAAPDEDRAVWAAMMAVGLPEWVPRVPTRAGWWWRRRSEHDCLEPVNVWSDEHGALWHSEGRRAVCPVDDGTWRGPCLPMEG